MNKLVQSKTRNNHIAMVPVGFELPERSDKEQVEWAELVWTHLLHDDIKRHKYLARRASHTLSVWSDDEFVYLVQVIRTSVGTNRTLVWIAKYSESQVNDFIAIVKFIHNNYDGNLKKPFELMEKMHLESEPSHDA